MDPRPVRSGFASDAFEKREPMARGIVPYDIPRKQKL